MKLDTGKKHIMILYIYLLYSQYNQLIKLLQKHLLWLGRISFDTKQFDMK